MIVPFCIGNFFELLFLTNISAADILNISLDDISGNDKFKEEGIILEKKQIAMTEAVYYILLSLQTPNHGYGIIQNIIQMTEGRLELGQVRSMELSIHCWIRAGFSSTARINIPGRKNNI